MSLINLELFINASPEICFDLSRSIDLHVVSTSKTKERAIAGRTSGLIQAGEIVTWEAVHFGVKQKLTVKITEMKRPAFFRDEMVKGAFKYFTHEHRFEAKDGGTLMRDIFEFESPLWVFGKMADALFLKSYMKKFLEERNLVIKQFAESGRWREVLPQEQI